MVDPAGVCDEHPTHESSQFAIATEASAELPCIRCGICCSVYQVCISRAEAERIADRMGMGYWDWVGRYCNPRWSDPRSHLIAHDDGGCVFLDPVSEGVSLCRIYEVRPDSCRAWNAGILKPACQEGLKRFWQVSISPEGRLEGAPESVGRLGRFLREL